MYKLQFNYNNYDNSRKSGHKFLMYMHYVFHTTIYMAVFIELYIS